MREILFRGKSKNGEWYYGYHAKFRDCRDEIYSSIIENDEETKEAYMEDLHHVIPETVGQFTGLTDKNGKKIFEGDIVRFSHEAYEEDFVGAVEFDDCESGFMLRNGEGWAGISYMGECYEVIGNIHDNPELLEV